MQQSLPLLLLALATPGLPPTAAVLAYMHEPFQRDALRALGLRDERILHFDPCVVYRAGQLYTVLNNGCAPPKVPA